VHHELKVLTDCLLYAGTFDQLNIPALELSWLDMQKTAMEKQISHRDWL